MNPIPLPNHMDDDDISLLLAEPDAPSRQSALLAIEEKHWAPMCCWLAREQGITDPHAQEDIVSEALRQFREFTAKGFSLNGPSYRAALYLILKRRGLDHLRNRRVRRKGAAAYEDYLKHEIHPTLHRENLDFAVFSRVGAILEEFRAAVPSLPPKQEAVARALAMLLETNSQLNEENIREAMQAFLKEPITLPSAKSAWAALRAKMREVLAPHYL